jgi:glucose-1-phosphate cytidylyltransferase
MIEIGGKPILWHILKLYSHYGINDFIICCGYKGYMIKEYFANYFLHMSDVTFDMSNNKMEVHNRNAEPWKVTLVDTGENTMTGGRLKLIKSYVEHEDSFCFTYGDGLSDVNLNKLIDFHNRTNAQATLTAVFPPARFGVIDVDDSGKVDSFREKPQSESGYINGGFFVLSPKVIEIIENDQTVWEKEPLERLAELGQLAAYSHDGFWQPMDTLRDKNYLEQLWFENKAPWKVWA